MSGERKCAAQCKEETLAAQCKEETLAAHCKDETLAAHCKEETLAAQGREKTSAVQKTYIESTTLSYRKNHCDITLCVYVFRQSFFTLKLSSITFVK